MQQKWAFFNYLHGGINAIGYQTITTRTIYVYTNAQTTHEFPMWIITSIKQKGKRIFTIVGKTYIILQDIYNIHSLDHYTLYIQRNMILVNHISWQLSYENSDFSDNNFSKICRPTEHKHTLFYLYGFLA